jgi:hypothetical protein
MLDTAGTKGMGVPRAVGPEALAALLAELERRGIGQVRGDDTMRLDLSGSRTYFLTENP